MYMDGVVAYGLVIVVLTCVFLAYLWRYVVKHIRQDMLKADHAQSRQPETRDRQ